MTLRENRSLIIAIIAGLTAAAAAGVLVNELTVEINAANQTEGKGRTAKMAKEKAGQTGDKENIVPSGKVIAAVPVRDFASLVTVIRPGGRINIVAGGYKDSSIQAKTILKNISVVKVPNVKDTSLATMKRGVLIALTVEESERLAAWVNDPSLYVVVSQ